MTPDRCPECGETAGHLVTCWAPFAWAAPLVVTRTACAADAPAMQDLGRQLLALRAQAEQLRQERCDQWDRRKEAEAEQGRLRARVAELEAQHDADGDAFASGRRYERAWLRARAAEQAAAIGRVRKVADDLVSHACLIRAAYAYNDYDRGRAIALEDAHKQLEAALRAEEVP